MSENINADIATVTAVAGATVVNTGKTKIFGLIINAASADVTTVIADDSTTKLTAKLDVTTDGFSKPFFFPVPFVVTTSLKVTVTGTGGSAEILYK